MPNSSPASIDSPPRSDGPHPAHRRAIASRWRINAALFVVTVASVFYTCMDVDGPRTPGRFEHAIEFTASLIAILLAHEFGHFVAARIHSVDASLPYFIPLPLLSPFGTLGAVIRMRSVIPTRRALLDIGAAGPLCGMVVAVPLYAWGVAHSQVVPLEPSGAEPGHTIQLGSSLLLALLDRSFGPHVGDGMDIMLSPVAYAAWAGMFVTMVNLLPVGQLDGGHVAYAWLGKRLDGITPWVHRSVLAFFFVSLSAFVARDFHAGLGLWHFGRHVNNALFWLVWFEVLAVLGTLSPKRTQDAAGDERDLSLSTRAIATVGLSVVAGAIQDRESVGLWTAWLVGLAMLIAMEVRWGALRGSPHLLQHPTSGGEPLRGGRVAVAALTLCLFALLFMPTPMSP